jgi:hypothetical protein
MISSHPDDYTGLIMEQQQAENGGGQQRGLFMGAKFWLAQRVPQRSRYIQLIKVDNLFNESVMMILTLRSRTMTVL